MKELSFWRRPKVLAFGLGLVLAVGGLGAVRASITTSSARPPATF